MNCKSKGDFSIDQCYQERTNAIMLELLFGLNPKAYISKLNKLAKREFNVECVSGGLIGKTHFRVWK